MNKHIQKQLKESFKSIPHLKEGFESSLSKVMDIETEEEEPLTGVGSGHDLDYDSLYSLDEHDVEYEITVKEHEENCKKCQNDEYCKELEEINEFEWYDTTKIFTDGDFILEKIEDDWQWDVKYDTITIKLNIDQNTFQVLKSPVTTRKGYASMCYPGQCDLDTEGDVLCYDLPEDSKREDW